MGLLPEIEAAAARAEMALREQALINAKSILEECRLKLLRQINIDDSGQWERQIHATSNPWIEPEPLGDTENRVAVAEKLRPDLGEARLRMEQGRLETIATRNGMLPRLDLFIDLGRTGYAQSVSSSFRKTDNNTYDFYHGDNTKPLPGESIGKSAPRGRVGVTPAGGKGCGQS